MSLTLITSLIFLFFFTYSIFYNAIRTEHSRGRSDLFLKVLTSYHGVFESIKANRESSSLP